jgi:hypothetical protein
MVEPKHADLTRAEEALVEQIAWRVGEEICKRIEKRIDERIHQHQTECATADIVKDFKARAGGFVLAFTLIGSFIGAVLMVAGRAVWNELTRR